MYIYMIIYMLLSPASVIYYVYGKDHLPEESTLPPPAAATNCSTSGVGKVNLCGLLPL